jgi:hypothetical protein
LKKDKKDNDIHGNIFASNDQIIHFLPLGNGGLAAGATNEFTTSIHHEARPGTVRVLPDSKECAL